MALRFTIHLKIPPLPMFHPTDARAILQQEVGSGVFELVEAIAAEARPNTPVGVSGIGRASIATRVTQGVDARHFVYGEVFTGAQAPHMLPLETGSRPHWPPWGPGSALALWSQRVLGDARLSFVVARKISRVGTKGRFMFRNALAVVRPRIRPTLQAAVDRAVRRMGGR